MNRNMDKIYHRNNLCGLVFCGFAIGGIIGPKFTVLVKDIGAVPYSMSYMITAAIAATGLIIAILVRIKKKQR